MTVHETPLPGDIGLTSVVGPVGWGIRLGEFLLGDGVTPYEHAFLVLDDGTLIEAQPGGARIAGLDEYAGRHVEFVSPELSMEQRYAICEKGRELRGTEYGFSDYLALALHRFHLPIPGLRRKIASPGSLICSQLVDLAYQRAGVQLFADGRFSGFVTPADLAALLGREGQR